MQPVTCRRCATEVWVEKFSWEHTNIQWSAPSAEVCPEVRERVEQGVPASRMPGCEELRASVHDAVSRGLVTVADG
jgi:hypothetical protein